jgi:hypothetical protein
VGNEIVQARLALQTWRPQFVACIGGANASVLAVMELLDILIRAEPIAEIFPGVWRDVVQIRLSAMHLLLSLYTVYSLRINDACVRAR